MQNEMAPTQTEEECLREALRLLASYLPLAEARLRAALSSPASASLPALGEQAAMVGMLRREHRRIAAAIDGIADVASIGAGAG